MSKYSMLLNVLDRIREEALKSTLEGRYLPTPSDLEKVNQARARAFIHLFLKVRFGLLGFDEREHYVSDGTQDGGIDGYFIYKDARKIFLLQSKFRTTEVNFKEKEIELDEILAMDVNRVLNGEETDEHGVGYNGKIKQLIREVSSVEDIGRYKYQVVLLANLRKVTESKLAQLTGGYPVEIVNHEQCYHNLVYPVIAGTYFNATDLSISIDLSNKNAGSKISYTVSTSYGECEITVLFVPTIEIAKVMSKYKNSILKYNPRSYLALEGQKVNAEIRKTILEETTNEFALFNNGITMLSDETFINEKIGQKNKAQLSVKNPQIINGGQTAYTLSRIYEEQPSEQEQDKVFEGKEVLLKVITLLDPAKPTADEDRKVELIDQISTATNQQTTVIQADRLSNEPAYPVIQRVLFDRYGLLFERKRGEFEDGLHKNYIAPETIIERNHFFRIYLASNGSLDGAIRKKLFVKFVSPLATIADLEKLDRFYFGHLLYLKIANPMSLNRQNRTSLYAKIYFMAQKYFPGAMADVPKAVRDCMDEINPIWAALIEQATSNSAKYVGYSTDKLTGERRQYFRQDRWLLSSDFKKDVLDFLSQFKD